MITSRRMPNHLRELMDQHGYSLIMLSRSGVSVTTISTIINGEHFPGPEIRAKIAQELGVSENQIWPDLENTPDNGSDPDNRDILTPCP